MTEILTQRDVGTVRGEPPWRPILKQKLLERCDKRFVVVPAGRRSGKTKIAKRKLVKAAIGETDWADAKFFAAAPTRDQAKKIYWKDLKRMIPRELLAGDPKEAELIIPLYNGAEIHVIGMDKPQRMEGTPWNGGVLDEYGNMHPEAWEENVRPALTDRRAWCWFIGVPEGRNHYHGLYTKANRLEYADEWTTFTWTAAEVLPAYLGQAGAKLELAAAARDLDPLSYAQEYDARFVTFEGRAYYPFKMERHAARTLAYDSERDLILCFDFNNAPGVAVVAQEFDQPAIQPVGCIIRDYTGVIGEVYIPKNSNTPAVCRKLIEQWKSHTGRVLCYGDATGGAKGTTAVEGSDWDLIKANLRPVFGDRLIFNVPGCNPRERARVNAVNSRLESATNEVRLLVDPSKAPMTAHDLDSVVTLKGGSGELDKDADSSLTHLCFAGDTLADTDHGSVAMRELPASGLIRTWDGSFVPFANPGIRGRKRSVRISLSDGTSVVCTPDHRFLTEKGWIEAKNLLGLSCCTWLLYQNQLRKGQAWKQRNSSGRSITGTASTSFATRADFTASCGNTTTGRSLRAARFTTPTETGETIALRTSSANSDQTMRSSTCGATSVRRSLRRLSSFLTFAMPLLPGITVRPAGSGTRNTPSERGSGRSCPSSIPAWSAGNLLSLGAEARRLSALGHVRQRIADEAVSIMSRPSVPSAGSNSARTSICAPRNTAHGSAPLRVVAVDDAGVVDVYCPTVPSTGCFALASGLLVCNSDGLGYYIEKEFPVSGGHKTVVRAI